MGKGELRKKVFVPVQQLLQKFSQHEVDARWWGGYIIGSFKKLIEHYQRAVRYYLRPCFRIGHPKAYHILHFFQLLKPIGRVVYVPAQHIFASLRGGEVKQAEYPAA